MTWAPQRFTLPKKWWSPWHLWRHVRAWFFGRPMIGAGQEARFRLTEEHVQHLHQKLLKGERAFVQLTAICGRCRERFYQDLEVFNMTDTPKFIVSCPKCNPTKEGV